MSKKMPMLFIGHGSPMNAIEDNEFTKNWKNISKRIPKPKAILSISAHWYTDGTRIIEEKNPKTIHDMYGFPKELYKVEYKSSGCPKMAELTKGLISSDVKIDTNWGYDHGTWSVLNHIYPEADIPVYQLSIDNNASSEVHFKTGRELRLLREKGILIIGSGNIVHNLRNIDWTSKQGYSWAYEFDNFIRDNILNRNYDSVVNYGEIGEISKLAFAKPEHFYPLLYILGSSEKSDKISIFNDKCILGSISMTSYFFE